MKGFNLSEWAINHRPFGEVEPFHQPALACIIRTF